MKSKNKLVFLKYYECPQVALDFGTGKTEATLTNYIDHNILILTEIYKVKGVRYRRESLNRITFRKKKWYYSFEPRIECDQKPLISMANLARNHAIRLKDKVYEFFWLRAAYKVEDTYK